jgi:UDP-N-acetyl-D-glucosamine dehydrogenase
MINVSVVGQGYVGLPISLAASGAGYRVTGIDSDVNRVTALKSGISLIEDVSSKELRLMLSTGRYQVTTDFNEVSQSAYVLICVPTPLTVDKKPDLSFLSKALKSVGTNLSVGTLVILESTVEPGTTRDFVKTLIEDESGLDESQYFLAFSPERIDPSNKQWGIKNTPKLVAGLNQQATDKAIEFYSKFVDTVVACESPEVAETAKLLENSFRLINISFINEVSMFCRKLGIDVNEVIRVASTKPYGFMPFFPSIGVGGHCIPVDPLYLANKSYEIGAPMRMINLANEINQDIPDLYVQLAFNKLGEIADKKILIIGLSYKVNLADVRETPVSSLIEKLRAKGARVFWHDDLVKEWNGESSVSISSDFDLAILATPHDGIDLTKLGVTPLINTRGSA